MSTARRGTARARAEIADAADEGPVDELGRRALKWMRRGFRRACRRYRGRAMEAEELFLRLTTLADGSLRNADRLVGMEMTVAASLRRFTVSIRVHDPA